MPSTNLDTIINIEDDEDVVEVLRDLLQKKRELRVSEKYEVELIGNGPEAEESARKWEECEKNPGHVTFIPVTDFTVDDLPEKCQNYDVLRAVQLSADLTVRIRGTKTGTGNFTGTGRIVDILPGLGPDRSWHRLRIMTAAHVAPDPENESSTRVDLYYDDEASRTVGGKMRTCSGVRVMQEDIDVDWCQLECELHDEEIAAKVKNDLDELAEVIDKLCKTPTVDEIKETVIIVSHPHGQPKMVTVGKLKKRDIFPSMSYLSGNGPWVYGDIEYDADTCPGCSGANILWLGFKPSRGSKSLSEYMWELVLSHSFMFTTQATAFYHEKITWTCYLAYLKDLYSHFMKHDSNWTAENLLFPFESINKNIGFSVIAGLLLMIQMMGLLSYPAGYFAAKIVHVELKTINCREYVEKCFKVVAYISCFCFIAGLLIYIIGAVYFTDGSDFERSSFLLAILPPLLLSAAQGYVSGHCDIFDNVFREKNRPEMVGEFNMSPAFICVLVLTLGQWFLTIISFCVIGIFYSNGGIVFLGVIDLAAVVIFLRRHGYFKISKNLLGSKSSSSVHVLSFVHTQGRNRRGYNMSSVGLWLQRPVSQKTLFKFQLWNNS